MKLLVIGSGGREHALVWKLTAERSVSDVICAPGNPGIARLARCMAVDPGDPRALLDLARREHVDLAVVGPELPLEQGLVDLFDREGLQAFGPTRAAAQLETSKVFAKTFMTRQGVPTARYATFTSAEDALGAVARADLGFPLVLKADGLAAGKGVVIAPDAATAEAAVVSAMVEGRFGAAGRRLVAEEYLQGEECSFFVICDGTRAVSLGSAQDHKRAFDNDAGPNTGGMGAFAPSPSFTAALERRVMSAIVEPVLAGLREEGHPFRGLLYVGLMLTADGPKVVEFNVRLGDPEAQVILPMLQCDLLPLLAAAAAGDLRGSAVAVATEPHVGVVLASAGYPDQYETGKPIEGLDEAEAMSDVLVFHSGTARRQGQLVTAGGRVLTVVGRGPSYGDAIERAYSAAGVIRFQGKHARTDIGKKAVARSAGN